MQITSTNFENLETIPVTHTMYGDNISPALTFSEIPDNAQSLALVVEDPDAPAGLFTHWVIYNMSPATLQIVEGNLPISGKQALNDSGQTSYFGPKPPEDTGNHRYMFKLYALDEQLDIPATTKPSEFRETISDHVIDEAELIGTFSASDYTKEN